MTPRMLTDNDLITLDKKGISESQGLDQLKLLQEGVPYIRLHRPCTLGDGITRLSEPQQKECLALYDREAPRREITKFTPASGATTRMFKDFIHIEQSDAFVEPDWIRGKAAKGDKASQALLIFMAGLKQFAFFPDLKDLSGHEDIKMSRLQQREHYLRVIRYLLHPVGLNYARFPQGLILFHRYPEGPRTAFEEHLVEAAHYAKGKRDVCRLHFTVSPDHMARFEARFNHVRRSFETSLQVHMDVHFSSQRSDIAYSIPRELLWQFLATMSLGVGLWYVAWRWTSSLNYDALWFALPIVLAELFAYIGLILFVINLWGVRDTPQKEPPQWITQCVQNPEAFEKRPQQMDIFFPTYNEEPELVKLSIRDAKAIDYPHPIDFATHVLDDGRRDEMKKMAEEENVNCITRSTNIGFKAGNLRNAMEQTFGDFIVICDADTRPFPTLLKRTLGYFLDRGIAPVAAYTMDF